MRSCEVVRSVALAAALFGSVTAAGAAEPVTIATVGPGNLAFLHYDLAQRLGYFKDEGLEATLQYTKSGAQATLAVLTGAAEFGGASFDNTVRAAAQGKP